jgi:hypothetical protein
MTTNKEVYKKVAEALRAKGIRINVGGCGCCGSPWVKVEVDGEVIADVDYFNFDMFDEASSHGG